MKETKSTLLKLTKEQVEKLRMRANSSNPTNQNIKKSVDVNEVLLQPSPYSRYESITGHIWVCASKARNIDNDKSNLSTMVQIVVNVRQRLRKPIPKNFCGNAALISITPQCEFGELMSQPLSYAAKKIREASWKMTDIYVTSAIDFLTTEEDICWTRTSSSSSSSIVRVKGTSLSNLNLSTVSWLSMSIYDADFGRGHPNYVGPSLLAYDGKVFIMPGSNNNGSIIIAIQLQMKHMEYFKE
ncbi:spermidine hydroxycinnamoyl transferase [Cucumis sativus]|uniref:spermidine hydroxycinnamoyl transferase n=1 Tax=Cucumis sativus TaxID=3659 RepID=UPI0002B45B34|nr:spermidine hydroxycinnamoyl transferase [Cucumis sativus]